MKANLDIGEAIGIKPRLAGVYIIKNSINGDSYIGSSFNMRDRIFAQLSRGRANRKLKEAISKFGIESFSAEALEVDENPTWKGLLEKEARWQKELSPKYNIVTVGEPYPDELRSSISKARRAGSHRHTDEWKSLNSIRMKGNSHALGHRHDEEARRRISESHKGKPKSPEHRAKIAAKNKERAKCAH